MESCNKPPFDKQQQLQQQNLNNWPPFPNAMFLPPPTSIPPPPIGSYNPAMPPPPFFFQPNFQHGGLPPQMNFHPLGFMPHSNLMTNLPMQQVLNSNLNSFHESTTVQNAFENKMQFHNQSNLVKMDQDSNEGKAELREITEWLDVRTDNWTKQQNLEKPKLMITIPEFKESLRRVMELDEKVKVVTKCLLTCCQGCHCGLLEDEDAHKVFIRNSQDEITNIRMRLNDETVDEMKKKLKERKKKRDRLKRKKEREREDEMMRSEKRRKIEEEIDEKIARFEETEAALKKEREVSKSADEILSEVRRKISDVKKSMKTLTTLKKLRDLRFNKKAGLIQSEITEVFNDRVESLFSFLKKQLDVYEAEQKVLQVMLNTEHKADREKALKRKKEKMLKDVKKEFIEINNILFGLQEDIDQSDPLLPFFQFYDHPNHDVNAFVQVRHQWDQYLVPPSTQGSSKIPPNWVMPSKPSDQSWANWLVS